jgi:hypothetical protein
VRKLCLVSGCLLGLLLALTGCQVGAVETLRPVPLSTPTMEPAALASQGTPVPSLSPPHFAGPWIEVDLTAHLVRLHQDGRVVSSYAAATGDGSKPAYTTWPGLFAVWQKYKGPEETSPGVYVTDILVFDLDHGNGFHSLPKDRDGRVLDARVGMAITAGCVRTAEAADIYDFAGPGTPVWIH